MGFQIKCGLVNPVLTKEKGLDGFVYAGELLVRPDFLAKSKNRPRFQAFSAFANATTRDLALVVDEAACPQKQCGARSKPPPAPAPRAFAVESVTIFRSLHRHRPAAPAKKSLAFALRFRSLERTLKDDEVNTVFTAIQQRLTADGKYAVRS